MPRSPRLGAGANREAADPGPYLDPDPGFVALLAWPAGWWRGLLASPGLAAAPAKRRAPQKDCEPRARGASGSRLQSGALSVSDLDVHHLVDVEVVAELLVHIDQSAGAFELVEDDGA